MNTRSRLLRLQHLLSTDVTELQSGEPPPRPCRTASPDKTNCACMCSAPKTLRTSYTLPFSRPPRLQLSAARDRLSPGNPRRSQTLEIPPLTATCRRWGRSLFYAGQGPARHTRRQPILSFPSLLSAAVRSGGVPVGGPHIGLTMRATAIYNGHSNVPRLRVSGKTGSRHGHLHQASGTDESCRPCLDRSYDCYRTPARSIVVSTTAMCRDSAT